MFLWLTQVHPSILQSQQKKPFHSCPCLMKIFISFSHILPLTRLSNFFFLRHLWLNSIFTYQPDGRTSILSLTRRYHYFTHSEFPTIFFFSRKYQKRVPRRNVEFHRTTRSHKTFRLRVHLRHGKISYWLLSNTSLMRASFYVPVASLYYRVILSMRTHSYRSLRWYRIHGVR